MAHGTPLGINGNDEPYGAEGAFLIEAGIWLVIAAIGPAKWKTGFQSTWVGAAYFWFFAATLAAEQGWTHRAWTAFAYFNGIVGLVTMLAATALTLYSLWLYLARFGGVFRGSRVRG